MIDLGGAEACFGLIVSTRCARSMRTSRSSGKWSDVHNSSEINGIMSFSLGTKTILL